MTLEAILDDLRNLSHADKIRAMQVLANEIAAEELGLPTSEMEYPIYTPYGNEEAAQIMLEVLEAYKASKKKSDNP